MRIISFIEDSEVIRKILKHLDLWDVKVYPPSVWLTRPPPKISVYPHPEDLPAETSNIISDVQQMPSVDDYLIDPEYPV